MTYKSKETHEVKELSIGRRILYFLLMVLFLWLSFGLLSSILRPTGLMLRLVTLFFFLVCLIPAVLLGYRIFVPAHRQRNISKWLGGFVTGSLLLLIAAALSIPLFGRYKGRAFDSDAKSNLHNMYLACHAYWAEKGGDKDCTVSIASQPDYGFVKYKRVNIEGHGTETTFVATAQHMDSTTQYTMDANGNIK